MVYLGVMCGRRLGSGFSLLADSRNYMKCSVSGALSRKSGWREMKLFLGRSRSRGFVAVGGS